MLCIEWLCCQ